MKKWILSKIFLNPTWNKLGKYMEPKINFVRPEDMKEGFGGYCKYNTFSCTINISNKYVNDFGIREHEFTHARQYGRLLWIHSLLSKISGTYNLFIELEAYRAQVAWYNYKTPSQYEWVIATLDTKYKTNTSKKEIRELANLAFKDLL